MPMYGIRPGEVVRIPIATCRFCGGFAIFDTDEYDHVCQLCAHDQNGGLGRLSVACRARRHITSDDTITIQALATNEYGQPMVILGCRRCGDRAPSEIEGREKSGRKRKRLAAPR